MQDQTCSGRMAAIIRIRFIFCITIRPNTNTGCLQLLEILGNLLEFKNPPGNPGNRLEFVWSSLKFLCKMSMTDCIGFQS